MVDLKSYANNLFFVLQLILKDPNEVLANRYAGDYELNNLRRYICYERYIYALALISLICLFLAYSFIFIVSIHSYFSYSLLYTLFIFLYCLFVYLLFLKFVVTFFINSFCILHYQYLNFSSLTIAKYRWQFNDLIFRNPIRIKAGTRIQFIAPRLGYFLYLLCQYPNGNIRWFGINNQNIFENNNTETTINSKDDVINLNIAQNMSFSDPINKFPLSVPIAIVGLRIRSNILNRKICIDDISIR